MQSIAFELEFIFTSIISKRKDAIISQVEKSEFDCELNSSSSEVFQIFQLLRQSVRYSSNRNFDTFNNSHQILVTFA
jgi:hypothetical protein